MDQMSGSLSPDEELLRRKHVRVAIADDHQLVRAGLKALLAGDPEFKVVADVADGQQLIAAVQSTPVDIVLCDLNMPHMDGMACLEILHRDHPEVRVIVLSMNDSPEDARLAMTLGASGYLIKAGAVMELKMALSRVMNGGTYMSPGVLHRMLETKYVTPSDALTQRQIQVLKLVAEGSSSNEIGEKLGLSGKTVDVHRARIMERLEISNIAGLTRYAMKHRLVA
jgi:DNA-binding NarL/FixJ family response regulator